VLWETNPNPNLYYGGWGFPRSSEVSDYNADCFPWRSGNGRYLLFASIDLNGPARPDHEGNWDIYISEWDSVQGHWGEPRNISPNVNTPLDERRPSCNFDCDTLYFHRKGVVGLQDIFMSVRDGYQWSEPCSLLYPVNTESKEEYPAISPDGRRLYFTSDRDGGVGGKDIWVAERSGAMWDTVYNLGPPINTPNEETRPFESFDGQRLYFSNQHGEPRAEGSYGGPGDIYVAIWSGSGWGEVQLVAAPVNNDLVACSPVESFDGSEIWFGSEAWEGARGDEDIWVARRGNIWPPLPTEGYGNWVKTGELENALFVFDLEQTPDGVIYAATACADTVPTGRVFRTESGGETWTVCADLPDAMIVYSLLVDEESIYAGTYPNGDVFKSTNGGASWVNTTDLPGVTAVRGMVKLENGDILVGTSPHDLLHLNQIFRTTDGGATWTETAALRHINPCKFLFQSSAGTVFAGGWGYDSEIIIHRSLDNGVTWDSLTVIPQFEVDWTADGFYETRDSTLYIVGWIPGKGLGTDGGFVYKSTDDGGTWTACEKVIRGDRVHNCRTYAIVEDLSGTIYIGMQPAPDSVVYASSDGGASWFSTGGLDGAFECLCLLRASDGIIYAGTTPNGDVFAYMPVTRVDEESRDISRSNPLRQNYPNPFNPQTTITFTIPEGPPVQSTLLIYNVHGREVRRMIDGACEPGDHTVTWDGRDDAGEFVPSGVYFYTLKTGKTVQTRKMIVAK
jgi:photosystem II stability/assembly factor-like uncharacterized protein